MTLDAVLEKFLKHCKDKGNSTATIENKRNHIVKFLNFLKGKHDTAIEDLFQKVKDVKEIIDKVYELLKDGLMEDNT